MGNAALFLLVAFVLKHFLADFVLQTPFMYRNKGKYGHLGGVLHSFIHASITFTLLLIVVPLNLSLVVASIEFFIHYHIDWIKPNITKKYVGSTPEGYLVVKSDKYFILLGLDQLLHYATYLVIVAFLPG